MSCKKVDSSRELETKSLFKRLEAKRLKGREFEWEYFPLSLDIGLNWRGLAFVQSTLDAKWVGKGERLGSFVPQGHYLFRQRVISISKYSGSSSSSYYWTSTYPHPPFLLTSELGNGETPGAGTHCREINTCFSVWIAGWQIPSNKQKAFWSTLTISRQLAFLCVPGFSRHSATFDEQLLLTALPDAGLLLEMVFL